MMKKLQEQDKAAHAAATAAAQKIQRGYQSKSPTKASAQLEQSQNTTSPEHGGVITGSRFRESLIHAINHKLDGVLDTLHASSHQMSMHQENKVTKLLREISAHLLHQYISYSTWNTAKALTKEASAVQKGRPEQPSQPKVERMHAGTLVKHFLQHSWTTAKPNKVPDELKMLLHGIPRYGGGKLHIAIGK